jgi:hypothetical protein
MVILSALALMEYYNTIQYDYNMIQGLYLIILFGEPTVWHFSCNTPTGLLASATVSIVPIEVLQIP